MFKERFEPFEIEVMKDNQGDISIFITQPAACRDEDSTIMIAPEQVEILISSLKRAKDSLSADSLK
jgi:hypothetical protein